jgi:hypothetical protein
MNGNQPWMQGPQQPPQQQQYQNTPQRQWQQPPAQQQQQWRPPQQPQMQQPPLRPVPPGIEPPQAKKQTKASTKKKIVLYTLLGLMIISTILFIITAAKYLTQ